jgi:hypothetical protein
MKNTFLTLTLLVCAAGILGAQTPTPDRIVGTWLIHVPGPDGQSFNALQTFNADGTFTETTDLLSQLVEGFGHGVWEVRGPQYIQTFELFSFDEKTQAPTGRIRVRSEVTMNGNDKFLAYAFVDLINLDGDVTQTISGGHLTATRIKVVPIPEIKPSVPVDAAASSCEAPLSVARRVGERKVKNIPCRSAR